MSMTCTICRHNQVDEINKQLLNGSSLRDIARHFDTTKDALSRHKTNCISTLLSKSKEIMVLADAESLSRFLMDEFTDIKKIKEQAIKGDNHELALKAVDRSLKTLELGSKIAGILRDREINITNQQQLNITNNLEWIRLREKIVRLLQPYPDALKALVEGLDGS